MVVCKYSYGFRIERRLFLCRGYAAQPDDHQTLPGKFEADFHQQTFLPQKSISRVFSFPEERQTVAHGSIV